MADSSSRRTIVRGERSFDDGGLKFADRQTRSRRTPGELVRGERSFAVRRTFAVYMKPVGVGDIFGELFASSRRTPRGFARTRANSRGVRQMFAERSVNAGERWRSSRNKKVGERLANAGGVRADSREFARVRASSRRTIVRQI